MPLKACTRRCAKNISNRKVFPTDESVIKILFLNIRNFTNRWTKRQGWDIVMNQLAVAHNRGEIDFDALEVF